MRPVQVTGLRPDILQPRRVGTNVLYGKSNVGISQFVIKSITSLYPCLFIRSGTYT